MAAGLLVAACPAAAATFIVTKTGDPVPNGCKSHDCSLREAIIAADRHKGRDTILLARKTYDLKQARSGEDDPKTGDLDVTDPVRILHEGRGRAVIDANGVDRAIHVVTSDSDRYTELAKIEIRGGSSSLWGGGVMVGSGLLGMTNSVVTHNESALDGGGIYASQPGELTLVNSTVSGNTAAGDGGGVFTAVQTTIKGSTISGNSADRGGGLANEASGATTVTNSTFTKNVAASNGGGVSASAGTVALRSVTVARNSLSGTSFVDYGGGVAGGGTVTIRNSIVALNHVGGAAVNPDCSGSFSSQGVNLFTDLNGCTGFNQPPNIVTSNPRLGRLANNGGPTETIALKKGSPAIGHAAKSAPARDQRGVKRDAHPDIGAFER
jgi:fibronectin-binding autotransporter adhesin